MIPSIGMFYAEKYTFMIKTGGWKKRSEYLS